MQSASFSEDKSDTAETARRLYRTSGDLIRRLEDVVKHATKCEDIFHQDTLPLRFRLREYCERLMFLDPTNYGRRGEEVLWKYVYYSPISAAKKLKKGKPFAAAIEHWYISHLNMGVSHYHHLIYRIQDEFHIDTDRYTDFQAVSVFPGCKKDNKVSLRTQSSTVIDKKTKEWANQALNRFLICLGDLSRYRQEVVSEVPVEWVAARYYQQALCVAPGQGMAHNQLGTMDGGTNYGLDAAHRYMRCLLSPQPFEGAEGNLQKIFDRARQLQPLLREEPPADIDQTDYRDGQIQRFMFNFLQFCDISFNDADRYTISDLERICGQIVQDLGDCILLPQTTEQPDNQFKPLTSELTNGHCSQGSECGDEETPNLTDQAVFKVVVMVLMCIQRMEDNGSRNKSAGIALCLSIFSHLLNHLANVLSPSIPGRLPRLSPTLDSAHPPEGDTNGHPIKNGLPTTNGQNSLNPKCRDSGNKTRRVPRRRRKRRLRTEDSDQSEDDVSERSSSDCESHSSDSSFSGSEDDEESEGEDIDPGSALKSGMRNGEVYQNGGIGPKLNNSLTRKEPRAQNESPELFSCPVPPKQAVQILMAQGCLPAIKVCCDWLKSNQDIISVCAQSTVTLWTRLATFLNLVQPLLEELRPDIKKKDLRDQVTADQNCGWKQRWALPEDLALNNYTMVVRAQDGVEFSRSPQRWMNDRQGLALRLTCLVQFGHVVTSFQETGLKFDNQQQLFYVETESNNSPARQLNKTADEKRRKKLMHNMAHLRLKAEVLELEMSVASSGHPQLSPYLVPDTRVLTDHLTSLRHLATARRFIIVIPITVIQCLDRLKREQLGAREAIRWMEAEFHRGNRYLRAQRHHERQTLGLIKYPKRKDKASWHFFLLLECSLYLSGQASAGRSAQFLVTLLLSEPDPANSSDLNKGAVALAAGINVENIEEFYNKWRHSTKSQG